MNTPGARASLRGFAAALLAAASFTVLEYTSLSDQMVAIWTAVFMAAFGAGEAIYDARRKA